MFMNFKFTNRFYDSKSSEIDYLKFYNFFSKPGLPHRLNSYKVKISINYNPKRNIQFTKSPPEKDAKECQKTSSYKEFKRKFNSRICYFKKKEYVISTIS